MKTLKPLTKPEKNLVRRINLALQIQLRTMRNMTPATQVEYRHGYEDAIETAFDTVLFTAAAHRHGKDPIL